MGRVAGQSPAVAAPEHDDGIASPNLPPTRGLHFRGATVGHPRSECCVHRPSNSDHCLCVRAWMHYSHRHQMFLSMHHGMIFAEVVTLTSALNCPGTTLAEKSFLATWRCDIGTCFPTGDVSTSLLCMHMVEQTHSYQRHAIELSTDLPYPGSRRWITLTRRSVGVCMLELKTTVCSKV